MGSRTASASRVMKSHVPLIRFPNKRVNPQKLWYLLCCLPSHYSEISKGSVSPELVMYHRPPDTAEIIKELPQKYRRNLISQD
ncbi:alpha-ketoglutarate dehydrogenase component 4-like [Rattus norvegicus]|uniref:alpha-ketoglutarate dehydrogenase component 4-like n=1 Tax=Rattus norvegicus TaxID=10116 RepID=UPI00081028C7|nr:28S ribosomal protein S36, mitochondrial-like [Rattus norvegicus]|eukprot:XP_017457712.1 PREDICTED: 28S ribosomal protein S36, mitochondrial-like [Rattus norvegicus]